MFFVSTKGVANGELRCNDFLELQPDGELCVVKTIVNICFNVIQS